ncbi:MAG: hypothetical protein P8Y45_10690 [Exilibacterium sp.]
MKSSYKLLVIVLFSTLFATTVIAEPELAPELTQWLRDHPAAMTALDRLSPGARARFLQGVRFHNGVFRGFSTFDLEAELDGPGCKAFLSAFGLEEYTPPCYGGEPEARRRIAAAPSLPSELENRFDTFIAAAHSKSDEGREKVFVRLFPEAQSAQSIAALGDHDLWLLFRAANYGDTPTATHVRILQRVFDTLHARKLATRMDHTYIQRRLLAAHLYADARAFNSVHTEAGLAAIPQIIDDAGPAWTGPTLLRQDGNNWRREPVDLNKTQVLVLHGCHFSEDAALDIAADPILGPVFAKHARWLSLPPGSGDFDAVSQWNHSHAPQRMEMLYDLDEWTLIDQWIMPTFIVVRDGREVDRFSGWRSGEPEFRQRLIAALRQVGLLDAPSEADADANKGT